MKVVLFNNMVTPYTSKMLGHVKSLGMDLGVLSCVEREANRDWGDVNNEFTQVTLKGWQLRLGPGRFAHINKGVWAQLSKLDPQLLIINGFYPSMLVGVAWAIVKKRRLSLTIDGWAETMPGSIAHRVVRKFVLSRCSAIAVPGQKGRQYFVDAGIPANDIFVVPIAPAWPGPSVPTPYEDRPWDILWAAHTEFAAKNLGFFIDLLEKLRSERPYVSVRVVGQGHGLPTLLRALHSLNLRHRHDKSVPWNEMYSVFEESKILVLPSRWEPWGLVANEAMQCGTPVIASPHVGAADDLIVDGRNGFVLPLDVGSWANRICQVISSADSWQPLSTSAYEDAMTVSSERSAASFVRFVEHALPKNGRSVEN